MQEYFGEIKFKAISFIIVLTTGILKLAYDIPNIKNSSWKVVIYTILINILILLAFGLLVALISPYFNFSDRTDIFIALGVGFFTRNILGAITNIGEHAENESPKWSSMIVEGLIKKWVNRKISHKRDIDAPNDDPNNNKSEAL